MARLRLQFPRVQEIQGGRGGNDVGVPAAGACVADQAGDLPGRTGAADDYVQNWIAGEGHGCSGDDAGSPGERAKLGGGIAVLPLEHFAEGLADRDAVVDFFGGEFFGLAEHGGAAASSRRWT